MNDAIVGRGVSRGRGLRLSGCPARVFKIAVIPFEVGLERIQRLLSRCAAVGPVEAS